MVDLKTGATINNLQMIRYEDIFFAVLKQQHGIAVIDTPREIPFHFIKIGRIASGWLFSRRFFILDVVLTRKPLESSSGKILLALGKIRCAAPLLAAPRCLSGFSDRVAYKVLVTRFLATFSPPRQIPSYSLHFSRVFLARLIPSCSHPRKLDPFARNSIENIITIKELGRIASLFCDFFMHVSTLKIFIMRFLILSLDHHCTRQRVASMFCHGNRA